MALNFTTHNSEGKIIKVEEELLSGGKIINIEWLISSNYIIRADKNRTQRINSFDYSYLFFDLRSKQTYYIDRKIEFGYRKNEIIKGSKWEMDDIVLSKDFQAEKIDNERITYKSSTRKLSPLGIEMASIKTYLLNKGQLVTQVLIPEHYKVLAFYFDIFENEFYFIEEEYYQIDVKTLIGKKKLMRRIRKPKTFDNKKFNTLVNKLRSVQIKDLE